MAESEQYDFVFAPLCYTVPWKSVTIEYGNVCVYTFHILRGHVNVTVSGAVDVSFQYRNHDVEL